jgi:hypothetical protein
LQTSRFIVASSFISDHKILRDGKLIFEHPGTAETFLDEAYDHFKISYPKYFKMDKLCKLGFMTAEILLQGRDHEKKYGETETGLILSNANASLDVDLKYAKTIQHGASPALFVYTLPNIVIGEISIRHHFKGENAFFVFKDFDGNFIAEYVNGLFDNKLVNSCICGWVDILQEAYCARLFLVEEAEAGEKMVFNGEHLNQLNKL